MSSIIDPTVPFSSVENDAGGLDITGFLDQENRLLGSSGDDVIIGGNLDDTLFGLGGNDFIDGLGGDDLIDGGSGQDTLVGGAGKDTLLGGSGGDIFVFDRNSALNSGEIDLIEDFTPGEDSLGIQGLASGDNVDYDRSTGILSLNGKAFAQLDANLDIQDSDLDFEDLIFGGSNPSNPPPDGGNTDEDVFTFDRDTAISSGEVVAIDDFVPGEDTIRIEGIASGDNIDYNRDTGVLSINGQDFAKIDRELPLQDSDFDLL
jgi:hypothetical protein